MEMENDEFKKLHIESRRCYYLDGIFKLEDFHFDNSLIDKKSHKNILIYSISYKTLIDLLKPLKPLKTIAH